MLKNIYFKATLLSIVLLIISCEKSDTPVVENEIEVFTNATIVVTNLSDNSSNTYVFEVEEHVNISRFARLDKIDKIYCVGSRMRKLYDVLPSLKQGFWTETAEEMQHVLVKKLKDGDIVMIKGSFSMGMNTIVKKLKNT